MFKKIASIALAAMMLGSTAVVASAAEKDEAVAAADDSSAVAAADDSAVGADEGSESTGAETKIYFDVNSAGWKNFTNITLYLYEHGGSEIIPWGSKKGNMTDEGNGKWSFDIEGKGYSLDSGKAYGCIFTGDWSFQTCDLIIGSACYGDTAECTGNQVENNVDSNKSSDEVRWKNADSSVYGNPICITSIGNVIGTAYWPGENAESVLKEFLTTDDAKKSIENAKKFTGKKDQEIIDATAKALGLSDDQVAAIIAASGKTFEWKPSSGSSTQETTSAGSGSSGSSSSGSSSSSSGSSSSSSSGSSGSTTTGSVTSGEGTTVYFVIGGILLAAAGVFFLARKKREY